MKNRDGEEEDANPAHSAQEQKVALCQKRREGRRHFPADSQLKTGWVEPSSADHQEVKHRTGGVQGRRVAGHPLS